MFVLLNSCLIYFLAKGFWADILNLKLSGPINLLVCDVIINVQSILCSVTPLFAGLGFFLWEPIWFGSLGYRAWETVSQEH